MSSSSSSSDSDEDKQSKRQQQRKRLQRRQQQRQQQQQQRRRQGGGGGGDYYDDDNEDEDSEGSSRNNNYNTNSNAAPSSSPPPPISSAIPSFDEETLRVMVSTDNHLGYCETDPIRGYDSFAAFEEVLYLAKYYECDMVLLAGDLFHFNKPSRRTLYRTIEILRRYCLGPKAVKIQVLSDPNTNFRNSYAGTNHTGTANSAGGGGANRRRGNNTVNYEDPYYSVDLPLFSIHGNHDDPARDGASSGSTDGTEMLAALDLLSISNLVNYFGRQDQVDKIEISPVLLQKGNSTKVALYGMGSMRDERLNRMWSKQKVRFLRPSNSSTTNNNDDDDDDNNNDSDNQEEDEPWFNIFALHQNRDLGRGSKNCVHESMIPEWMDLVVWGHEHECMIVPNESVVGTFRITQPGSSVATSLTAGESVKKQVGILDIRGNHFRLTPIPLVQVRSFVTGELVLSDYSSNRNNVNVSTATTTMLDPEDPQIEDKITKVLEEEVRVLVHDAREQIPELFQDAKKAGNVVAAAIEKQENKNDDDDNDDEEEDEDQSGLLPPPLKYQLQKRKEVLVRIRVDHSGFSTLNNQRFGARFVGQVANPADVLLFSRASSRGGNSAGGSSGSKSKAAAAAAAALQNPISPEELEQVSVENLIKDNLENWDQKLTLLSEQKLGLALEEFVDKNQIHAISEATSDLLQKQQRKLVIKKQEEEEEVEERKDDGDSHEEEEEEQDNNRTAMEEDDDDDEDMGIHSAKDVRKALDRGSTQSSGKKRKAFSANNNSSIIDISEDENDAKENHRRADNKKAAPRRRAPAKKTATPRGGGAGARKRKQNTQHDEYDDDDDDDDDIVIVKKNGKSKSQQQQQLLLSPPPSNRRNASSRNRGRRVNYSIEDDDDNNDFDDDDGSDFAANHNMDNDDDDDDLDLSDEEEQSRKKTKGRGRTTATKSSQQKRGGRQQSAKAVKKPARRKAQYKDHDDSDDDFDDVGKKYGLDGDWGSAMTSTQD